MVKIEEKKARKYIVKVASIIVSIILSIIGMIIAVILLPPLIILFPIVIGALLIITILFGFLYSIAGKSITIVFTPLVAISLILLFFHYFSPVPYQLWLIMILATNFHFLIMPIYGLFKDLNWENREWITVLSSPLIMFIAIGLFLLDTDELLGFYFPFIGIFMGIIYIGWLLIWIWEGLNYKLENQ